MDSSGIDIKNKKGNISNVAPTPQNTPLPGAPITTTSFRPDEAVIEEDENDDQLADLPSGALKGAFTNNPALLGMLQGKLGTLVGRDSGYIKSLPKPVQDRINSLKALQEKHGELEKEFQHEILALEKKYAELYKPIYQRRSDIVNGKADPTKEEIEIGEKVDEDLEEQGEGAKVEETGDEDEGADTKGIPEFWLTAMKNHTILGELITDKDEEALKHLINVRMSYLPEPGFKLEFEFAPNPFFNNTVLTKTYYYQDQAGYGGDFIYDHAEGTEIDWKAGKDLTVKVEKRTQRHKGTNKTRVVKRTVPAETFFHFFKPPVVPDEEDNEVDEDEIEELDQRLEADYQLGEDFKEKIIPHAIDWFTGKALAFEELDDDELDEDYEDEFDEDEDDEDDEDEDDEEEDDATAPAQGQAAPECKQS